jgi:hypothetical protein
MSKLHSEPLRWGYCSADHPGRHQVRLPLLPTPFGGVSQTGTSLPGPWLQHHNGSLPGSECRIGVKVRV